MVDAYCIAHSTRQEIVCVELNVSPDQEYHKRSCKVCLSLDRGVFLPYKPPCTTLKRRYGRMFFGAFLVGNNGESTSILQPLFVDLTHVTYMRVQ